MYLVSYRYNQNTTNPYSVYKQPNPDIYQFYSVYKKGNYSFPYKFGFVQIIRIRYTPRKITKKKRRENKPEEVC